MASTSTASSPTRAASPSRSESSRRCGPSGMRPYPTYAFVPEGTMALSCDECDDEEYHLWDHELAVITRRRTRGDDTEVTRSCSRASRAEAPACAGQRRERRLRRGAPRRRLLLRHSPALGLRTRIVRHPRHQQGRRRGHQPRRRRSSTALVEIELPARVGGGAGDFQFVERDGPTGTTVTLRVHRRLDVTDEHAAATPSTSCCAPPTTACWPPRCGSATAACASNAARPLVTRAGKTLSFERLGDPARPAETETKT